MKETKLIPKNSKENIYLENNNSLSVSEIHFQNLSSKIHNMKIIEKGTIIFLSLASSFCFSGFSTLFPNISIFFTNKNKIYSISLFLIFGFSTIIGAILSSKIKFLKTFKYGFSLISFILTLFTISIYLTRIYPNKQFIFIFPLIFSSFSGISFTLFWVLHAYFISNCLNPFNEKDLIQIFWKIYCFHTLFGFTICYFLVKENVLHFLEIIIIVQIISTFMFLLLKEPDIKFKEKFFTMMYELRIKDFLQKNITSFKFDDATSESDYGENLSPFIEFKKTSFKESINEFKNYFSKKQNIPLLNFCLLENLMLSYYVYFFPKLIYQSCKTNNTEEEIIKVINYIKIINLLYYLN